MTDDERRHLYDEVWAEPMLAVAKRYGLSDVGLAKLCRRAQIPVPPRGYWARLRAGQRVGRPPLADVDREDIARLSAPDMAKACQRQPEQADPDAAAALERERHPSFAIDPEARGPSHPIAARIEAAYVARHADADGLLVGAKGQKLAISVGPGCLSRGLKIINLIAHAGAARGWNPGLAERPADDSSMRPLQLELLGCRFAVSLGEGVHVVEVPRPASQAAVRRSGQRGASSGPYIFLGAAKPGADYEPRPDGCLALEARFGWRVIKIVDRPKRGPIECRLNELFSRMIRAAADFRAEEGKKRREEEERDAAWREHEDREHLGQFQARLVGDLQFQAGLWAKHQQIARYIAAVREAYVGEPHLMAPDQPLGRWLAWADAHVAQLDPRRHRKLDPESPPLLVRQPRPPNW